MRNYKAVFGIGMVVTVFAGCEYDTVTEARNQLAAGRADTVGYVVPIFRDTVFLSDLLGDDTVTTADGLLGLRVQNDSLAVSVGDQLQFDAINLTQFAFSFDQMLGTKEDSTTIAKVFPAPGPSGSVMPISVGGSSTISFTTDDGSAINSATVASGWLVRRIENGTTCDATNITVDVEDSDDDAVAAFPAVSALSGATVIDSIDLSGVVVPGAPVLKSNLDVGICVPAIGASFDVALVFRPLTLSSVAFGTLNETFNETYAPLASELRITAVDTIEVVTGDLTISVQNRLPVAVDADITLGGFYDNFGVPVTANQILTAAAGDGSTVATDVVFDLAGVTIVPADVNFTTLGTASGANITINALNATNAAVIDGTGSFVVSRLAGALDPATTPELVVDVEQSQTLTAGTVDFADLSDAVRDAVINQALIDLTIANGANVAATLDNVTLGIVQLDGLGGIPRDGSGVPVYEEDGGGNPILVTVANSGSTTLAVPRNGTVAVTVNAAPLVDRMVKLLLDGVDVALITGGQVIIGDGTQASIANGDSISVTYDVTVPIDLTLPLAGIAFDVNQVTDGVSFDTEQVNALAPRIVEVGVIFRSENTTAFGAGVVIAIAPDSLGEGVDVAAAPGAVVFDQVQMSAPTVDINGISVGTTTDSLSITVTGSDAERLARIALGDQLTVGITASLLPGTGGAGRGAVRPTDQLVFKASVIVRVKRGGQ